MADQSLKPIIDRLESLFSKFNAKFYGGELQKPIITVSPDTTKGAFGWCTGWKAWKEADDQPADGMQQKEDAGYYEINMCAEHLSRPFEQIAETLLHEMAHLFNLQNGVQDTSRGGFYHNKKYQEAAEAHGLKVEKTQKYGYSKTTLNDEAKAFVEAMQDKKFQLYRESPLKLSGAAKSKQSSRKYVCPLCGTIIRATKEVNVVCGDCEIPFVEEEANESNV